MIELQETQEVLSNLSDTEFLGMLTQVQLRVMDAIIIKKLDEDKIVFYEVENGLLN